MAFGRRALMLGAGALALPGVSRPGVSRAASANSDVAFQKQYVPCRYGQLHLHMAQPRDPARRINTPMVCLHPTPASGRYFLGLMGNLGADRVAMAIDTPGYGESDRPPYPVTVATYADAMADGLKALGYGGAGKQVDLLGYHTGCLIAVDLAVRYPALVRRLVLTAVPYYADPEQRAAALARVDRWTFSEDPAPVLELWENTVAKRAAGVTLEQSIDQFLERLRPGDKEWWAYEAVWGYDTGPALAALTQPTAVLNPHGPLRIQTLAAAAVIPRAKLVDLPGLTHGVFQLGSDIIAAEARKHLDGV